MQEVFRTFRVSILEPLTHRIIAIYTSREFCIISRSLGGGKINTDSSDHARSIVIGRLGSEKKFHPSIVDELLQSGEGGHYSSHSEQLCQRFNDRVDITTLFDKSYTVAKGHVHYGIKCD